MAVESVLPRPKSGRDNFCIFTRVPHRDGYIFPFLYASQLGTECKLMTNRAMSSSANNCIFFGNTPKKRKHYFELPNISE